MWYVTSAKDKGGPALVAPEISEIPTTVEEKNGGIWYSATIGDAPRRLLTADWFITRRIRVRIFAGEAVVDNKAIV